MNNNVKQTDCNVIVVGAGNSALVSALSAHEAGARVLILEVAPREIRGGNTYFTGGGFRVPLNGLSEVREFVPDISDTEASCMEMPAYTQDDFYGILMSLSQGLADPSLAETVVTRANPTLRWMTQQGIRWEPYVNCGTRVDGRIKWMPGNQLLAAKGEGRGLSDMLFDLIEKKGIDILYETRAVKLLINSKGGIYGVGVKDKDGYREIRSKAVILACGGFESNREMRAQYLGGRWEMARVRGTRYNMGSGIKMALQIGAQPAGQWSKCHGTQVDLKALFFGDRVMGDKTQRGSYPLGIIVNCNGQRFYDEGEDTYNMTYAKLGETVLNQPRGIAFQIFNSDVEGMLEPRYSTSVCTRANTIRELADALGLDAAALTKTVEEFNASVQEGPFDFTIKDGKHTVGVSPPKSNWAQKLDRPPFLAYAVTGGITFTYGGIKINTGAQVLDTEDRVIPGLYAAGEIMGGLFYHAYPGGTCLMAGAVFGRLAGADAAQR